MWLLFRDFWKFVGFFYFNIWSHWDRSSKINADGIEHKSLIPKNFSNQLLKNLLDLLNQNKKTQIQTNNKKIMVENLLVDLSFPIPNGTIELSNNVCIFVLNLFIKSR